MQTIVQIICNDKISRSLRAEIGADVKHLEKHLLHVVTQKKKGRSGGWTKVHGIGKPGALNIEWDARINVLLARVVTRGTDSSVVIGRFVSYMLNRYKKKIVSIAVLPG